MILVTGGAGYIGSQVAYQLLDSGESIIILDNLSTGDQRAIPQHPHCHFVQGDIGDVRLLNKLFKEYSIEAVMHFAASTVVPESVEKPLDYYENNTAKTMVLLQACKKYKIKKFIFSSTAAVYGVPKTSFVNELSPCEPINPYGMSKLMVERCLADADFAKQFNYVVLRYFNVAGADPQLRTGPRSAHPTLLIRVAVRVVLGLLPVLKVYGSDYATPDGTGVRDYIHVVDIANAHIAALQYLRNNSESVLLNCGYGHGVSVREVIAALEKITGKKLPVEIAPRRAGDPDQIVAEAKKIAQVLSWQPQYNDLEKIVTDALNWEKQG